MFTSLFLSNGTSRLCTWKAEVRELSHELSELKQVLVEKNSEISELKSDIDLLSDSMDMVSEICLEYKKECSSSKGPTLFLFRNNYQSETTRV